MAEVTKDQPLAHRTSETRTIVYRLPSKPVYSITVNLVWEQGTLRSALVHFGFQDVPWEDLETLAAWVPAVWQAERLRYAEELPRP